VFTWTIDRLSQRRDNATLSPMAEASRAG
jgi:hypothetical protein